MDGFQQNEKTRKRFKYLGHIPLNADIKFVNIEMNPFLTFETLLILDEEVSHYVIPCNSLTTVNLVENAQREEPSERVRRAPPSITQENLQ